MSEKISVLMGVYNCADTIEEAVDSIRAQTYENWELIICDDCSVDGTYEAVLKIARTDRRVTVIKNEKNLTLAPTLNRCLALAAGEYIARMDGDDVCDPTRFEREISFLKANPQFALVSTRMNLYDSGGIFRTTSPKEFPEARDLVYGPPFCHAGCMLKTGVMKELGGYNTDKDVERVEDLDLWYRLYRAGYKGANLQQALYSMRDDRNAVKRRKMKYRINSFRIRKKVIKDFNLSKKYYINAVKPILIGLVPTPIYRVVHRK